MKLKFFASCKSKQEAKKMFRDLAKKYHPDKGGDNETMKQIIAEYEYCMKKLPSVSDTNDSSRRDETEAQYKARISQEIKDILENISHLPLNIEVIGSWIWVSGNTYPYKSYLTAYNFLWSREKQMYYWRPEERKSFRLKNYKGLPIEDIRMKYGSVVVPNQELAALA